MSALMCVLSGISDDEVSVEASEMRSISAVTFCCCEHSLPLESLSSTRTCVVCNWLTVADRWLGSMIWLEKVANCSIRG